MNHKKVAFIICTNNKLYYEECVFYLSKLIVPEDMVVDIIAIENAEYLTKAYNDAMKRTDAKYKVYLHQDTFIINQNFIEDVLRLFNNPEIGMIGLAGIEDLKRFFINGFCWSKGEAYVNAVTKAYRIFFGDIEDDHAYVQAIDGMIMITQYDYPWREDRYKGWDYYDISQSMVFLENGKKIVVPKQNRPWIMHDHGILNYGNYNYWKQLFLEEYPQFKN